MLRALLEFVLVLVAARALWRVIDGAIQGLTGRAPSAPPHGARMVRDPMCGTFVLPDRAVKATDGSHVLFFCSTHCRDAYRARDRAVARG